MDFPPGVVTVLVSVFSGGLALELARRGGPVIATWLKRRRPEGPWEKLVGELQEENRGLREENRKLRDELRAERGERGNDDD